MVQPPPLFPLSFVFPSLWHLFPTPTMQAFPHTGSEMKAWNQMAWKSILVSSRRSPVKGLGNTDQSRYFIISKLSFHPSLELIPTLFYPENCDQRRGGASKLDSNCNAHPSM